MNDRRDASRRRFLKFRMILPGRTHLAFACAAVWALASAGSAELVSVAPEAREVLEANPQLRDVPDFPPIAFAPGADVVDDGLIKRIYLAPCPFPFNPPPQPPRRNDPGVIGPQTRPPPQAERIVDCLFVVFRGSHDPAACEYDIERRFYVALASDRTRAVNAYAFNGEYGDRFAYCLMARFDDTRRIVWRRPSGLDEAAGGSRAADCIMQGELPAPSPPKGRTCNASPSTTGDAAESPGTR